MRIISGQEFATNFPVAIVVSRFNQEITQKLYEGAIERLNELHFSSEHITVVWVPGAVEIPLAVQRLAKSNQFEVIICLGAVIRGETSHYDYVCKQVSDGCQKIALEQDLPVIFGILTTESEEQALDRIGGKHGHKGREAVDAACDLVSVLRHIG